MAYSDKLLGFILLAASFVIFTYYSVWVLLLPFLEPGNPILQYFLPKEYAISIPATLLVVAISVVGIFIGVTITKFSNNRKKK